MKIQLNKQLRLAVIVLFVGFFAVATFFSAKALVRPGTVEEMVPQFSYSQQARVDYRVFLKPNSLYSKDSLEAKKVYLTNFVDYINTEFSYKFNGDRATEVKGEYSIMAILEARGGKENATVLWQREFELEPGKSFGGKDGVVSLRQDLPVRLSDYNDFVNRVVDESEVTPGEVKLTVRWNVNVEAITDNGPVREQIAPTMVIPLRQKAFEVGGDLIKEKPGAINDVRKVPAKINVKTAASWGIAAALGLAGTALLLLFTVGTSAEKDPLRREIRKILKKHGDRLAVIVGEMPVSINDEITVKSMDDLVRIADELSKPIMYRPFSESGETPSFYVFDVSTVYVFELKDSDFYL